MPQAVHQNSTRSGTATLGDFYSIKLIGVEFSKASRNTVGFEFEAL
jgi:hypothetical protein